MKTIGGFGGYTFGEGAVNFSNKMKKFYNNSLKGGLSYNEFILAIVEHYPMVKKLDCGTLANIGLMTAYIPPARQLALVKL